MDASSRQAGRQAASQGIEAAFCSLLTQQPPSCEAPLGRYKLDLARILASSQMLCVAAWCQSANSPSPAALISTGRLLARHLLEASHSSSSFFFFFSFFLTLSLSNYCLPHCIRLITLQKTKVKGRNKDINNSPRTHRGKVGS